MPIKPENRKRYPPNWQDIRDTIIARAGNCCEGSPKFPACRAPNAKPHPTTGSIVVLTVAHLDHVPEHVEPENLRAWCQRCHLAYDAVHHQQTAAKTRHGRKALGDLFDPQRAAYLQKRCTCGSGLADGLCTNCWPQ